MKWLVKYDENPPSVRNRVSVTPSAPGPVPASRRRARRWKRGTSVSIRR